MIRTTVAGAIMGAILLAACGGEGGESRAAGGSTANESAASESSAGPGEPAVYERIAASADCAGLQSEFDIAMDSAERRQPGDSLREVSISYAKAADERMREVGCYD